MWKIWLTVSFIILIGNFHANTLPHFRASRFDHSNTRACAHTRSQIHPRTRTCTHTYTHAHMHARAHAPTQGPVAGNWSFLDTATDVEKESCIKRIDRFCFILSSPFSLITLLSVLDSFPSFFSPLFYFLLCQPLFLPLILTKHQPQINYRKERYAR